MRKAIRLSLLCWRFLLFKPYFNICQRLRHKRRAMRIRQVDVATYMGFGSKNDYWSIENGRTRLRVEHILAL